MSKQDTTDTTDTTPQSGLLTQAGEAVRMRFATYLPAHRVFHNYAHTVDVVDAITTLAKQANLDAPTQEQLQLAAWWLYTGYTQPEVVDPYDASAKLAHAWLQENNYDTAATDRITDWIRHIEEEPDDDDHAAQLLSDAHRSWFGRKKFSDRANMLRIETETDSQRELDSIEWSEEMQERLIHTRYHSLEGREEFERRRVKNMVSFQADQEKQIQNSIKAKTGKNFGRGIDTLYRTSFRNHINLSRIADGKANMMISINAIILSILIAVSGASFSIFEEVFFENPLYLLPIIVLLLSSLTAVVFAIFSARPKVTEYRIKKKRIADGNGEASLLYFGNFLQLEKRDFIDYLSTMKLDQDRLYDDLSKDLYDLGQVLHQKYLLLTLSYNIFAGGLVLGVLSFLGVYLYSIL